MNITASQNAPLIFFEQVSAAGHSEGVMRVTVEAQRILSYEAGESVTTERVITAHLRMTIPAARSLVSAIEQVLALVTRAEEHNEELTAALRAAEARAQG